MRAAGPGHLANDLVFGVTVLAEKHAIPGEALQADRRTFHTLPIRHGHQHGDDCSAWEVHMLDRLIRPGQPLLVLDLYVVKIRQQGFVVGSREAGQESVHLWRACMAGWDTERSLSVWGDNHPTAAQPGRASLTTRR